MLTIFPFIGNKLHTYSKVIEKQRDTIKPRPLPFCPALKWAKPFPQQEPAPANLFQEADRMT